MDEIYNIFFSSISSDEEVTGETCYNMKRNENREDENNNEDDKNNAQKNRYM
jgi:hypothetical protein